VRRENYKKKDLIKDLSSYTGFPPNYSKKIINDLINILTKNIELGYLNIKNIGVFKIINKSERVGRNPKTKEKFIISARKAVRFIPSKKISEELNE
tara:strand:- start:551 stop:838 length:288 start_codon:yes stop_codon:yes gene_type:complete